MKLNVDSKTVRWAYLFGDYVPHQTSLCAIFWRCVLLTPLKLAFIVFIGSMLATLIIMLVKLAYLNGAFTAIFVGLVTGLAVFAYLNRRSRYKTGDSLIDKVGEWPVIQGAKAVKGKICPIVELE